MNDEYLGVPRHDAAIAQALRDLPAAEPPAGLRERVRWRLLAAERQRRLRRYAALAASLALLTSGVAVLPALLPERDAGASGAMHVTREGPALAPDGVSPETMRGWVVASQRLEAARRHVQRPERVVNLRTARAIASLEDQIGLIDRALFEAASDALDARFELRLWQERVRLMEGLVALEATSVAALAPSRPALRL